MLIILLILVLLILCLGDIIWENCNRIFDDFLIRAPVEHDGKGSIDQTLTCMQLILKRFIKS